MVVKKSQISVMILLLRHSASPSLVKIRKFALNVRVRLTVPGSQVSPVVHCPGPGVLSPDHSI